MTAFDLGAASALDIGCRLAALAQLHNALQVVVGRADFAPGGALDPRLTGRRAGNGLDRVFQKLVGRRFAASRTVLPVAVVQTTCALVVLALPRAWPALLVLCLAAIATQPVLRPGLDGGDEMLRVITVVMLLRALTGNETVQVAAAGFVAFQLCLSYAVSGLSKGQSIMWWSGAGIRGVVSTQYFGTQAVARRLARSQRLARVLGWTIILWESLFFAAVLAGPTAALIALTGALGFHVLCAVVMGLDGFLLPFAATFPSVYFASAQLAVHVPSELRLLIGALLVCAVCAWLAHWRALETVRSR